MINRLLKPLAVAIGIFGLLVPASAFAQETTQTVLGSVSNFGEFVSLAWNYGAQVLIALAVFFIVLGAIFYVASAGNEERIAQGKQMIIGSLVAVVLVILSGVLIRTLHQPTQGTTGALTDVPTVIRNATNILVGTLAGFSVLMLTYAGFLYTTAQGDAEKVGKAHAAIRYAVIGLVIGALAYLIVTNVVNYFL